MVSSRVLKGSDVMHRSASGKWQEAVVLLALLDDGFLLIYTKPSPSVRVCLTDFGVTVRSLFRSTIALSITGRDLQHHWLATLEGDCCHCPFIGSELKLIVQSACGGHASWVKQKPSSVFLRLESSGVREWQFALETIDNGARWLSFKSFGRRICSILCTD